MPHLTWLMFLGALAPTSTTTNTVAGASTGSDAPLVVLESSTLVQNPGQAAYTEARRILAEVVDVYGTCSSYRDSGTVENLFIHSDRPKRTVVMPFETTFVRDEAQFRFEFRDRAGEYEWNKYVVWSDGEEVHSSWTIKPGVRDWDNLGKALGAANGVSSRSATIIPSMLLGWQSQYLSGLFDAQIAGSESLDGVRCVKIEAFERRGGPTCTVWVDENRLVRKVYSVTEIAPAKREAFTVHRTITWTPSLERASSGSTSIFEPPALDRAREQVEGAEDLETVSEVENHEPDPKAEQLLLDAREVYATCSSYRDEGQVESLIVHPDWGPRTTVRPFETAFVRETGAFRFEFRDRSNAEEGKKYVVWRDGGDVKSWWTIQPEVREWENLRRALAGPTGISGTSAITVPSLLMVLGDEARFHLNFLAKLRNPRIIGSDPIGDSTCVKIKAVERTWVGDRDCVLWLDEKLLIRKLYRVREIDPAKLVELPGAADIGDPGPPFTVKATITWTPIINEGIPESALGFTPPGK